MIHLKLRRARHLANYTQVERLHREAHLQVRRRKRKQVPIGEPRPLLPVAANQVWSPDFVFDRAAEGRVAECQTIVDDATHKAVAIEVERVISRHGVVRVMKRLALSRGLPQIIRTATGRSSVARRCSNEPIARATRHAWSNLASQTRTPTFNASTAGCAMSASMSTGSRTFFARER
jgi:hypothetical protein